MERNYVEETRVVAERSIEYSKRSIAASKTAAGRLEEFRIVIDEWIPRSPAKPRQHISLVSMVGRS